MQATTSSFEDLRNDFPVLSRRVRDDKKLVYLDNAATTQKPNQVIDAISDYYRNHNSNIHRAVHALAEESTEAFEKTRDKVAKFLNVKDSQEIIFVRGTTEGINLVAYAWGRDISKKMTLLLLLNMNIIQILFHGNYLLKKKRHNSSILTLMIMGN